MREKRYEYAVIGLGVMGLSCASYLSKEHSVVGFEQYNFNHSMGSSYCESKIFRLSCFEGIEYSRLAHRALSLWKSLGRKKQEIFLKTGVIVIGNENSAVINGTKKSNIDGKQNQHLTSNEINHKFPAFKTNSDHVGILDENSGILLPHNAHQSFLKICEENGMDTYFNTGVESIEISDRETLKIFSDKGIFIVDNLIVCAGPWIDNIISKVKYEKNNLVQAQRLVPMWFTPAKNTINFKLGKLPAYYWDIDGRNQLYGIPIINQQNNSAKVGLDSDRTSVNTANINRNVNQYEIQKLEKILSQFMPDLKGRYIHGSPCMFSMTPDSDFLIGNLDTHHNIFLVGGFSGRGYKFAPAVGEMVYNLLTKGYSEYYSDKFNPNRFII